MIYIPGEAFYLPFLIRNAGVLADADALPTANLMSGAAVVSAAVVASRGSVGQYVVTGNLPAGAVNGAKYWVRVLATVGGITVPLEMEVGTVRPFVRVPALGAFSDTDAADTVFAWMKAMMAIDATSPTSLPLFSSTVSSLEALATSIIPEDVQNNLHYAARAILSMVQEDFEIGGVAKFQDYALPDIVIETLASLDGMIVGGVFTAEAMANVSGALTGTQAAQLAFVSLMIGADVKIDKLTDPTCYNLVYFVAGTATEIARKELRDIDGAKINTDSKIPRQLLEVAAP